MGEVTIHDRRVAAEVLGAAHPLVDVLAQLETVGQQLVSVAVVCVLALTWLWAGVAIAGPLVTSSVIVLVVLGCRRLLLVQRRRELCLDLIVAGRALLPLAAVARERRRLSSAEYRACLARSLEALASEGARGYQPLTARPWIDMTELRRAAAQLHELARLLRGEHVSARGVAVTELLLSSPESPLYGSEPGLLRQELGRALYLLSESDEPACRSWHPRAPRQASSTR